MKRPPGKVTLMLWVALIVLWLLLNQSVSPGHILLGAVLSWGLLRFSSTLRPLQARVHRVDVAIALILRVTRDIIVSNYNVGRIVLGLAGNREVHSGFVDIPLELRDPHGLAALACIVTATPGTVWSGLSESGDTLTLHVLDLRDAGALSRMIKERYEGPLRRIFE